MTGTPELYWIIVGDLHDHAERLAEIPGLAGAAGVIVSGDLTVTGGISQARKVMEAVAALHPCVLAQIGNMDRPEVADWLDATEWRLDGRVREIAPDTVVMGIGGSTFTPFGTPSEFPETYFADRLETMWHEARHYRRAVLVAHNPPADTLCDLAGGTTHVGSTAVREFLVECQPDVCLCGHIHESAAVDRLGRTLVANPGPLGNGGYAVLRLADGKLSVTLHNLERPHPCKESESVGNGRQCPQPLHFSRD